MMMKTLRKYQLAISVLFLLKALAFTALAQPALTPMPRKGPPHDKVRAAGTGFGATEIVDIYFDTTDQALARTASDGSFSHPIRVPESATPGKHWISGVGRKSGLTAQHRFIVQTDWRKFHAEPDNDGENSTENVLSVSNVGGMQVLWTVLTNGPITCSPAVVDGVVYAGDASLMAVDAANGKVIWSTALGGVFLSSPAVADGVVYIGDLGGEFHALNAATGKQIWTASTGSSIYSSPTVVKGVVYVGSNDNHLYAFNAGTGHQLWNATTAGPIYSSPAVANGMVYVGSSGVYAFNAATGAVVWSSPLGTIQSSLAVAKGAVFVGTQGGLVAFDAGTGSVLWSASGSYRSPGVSNGVVFAAGEDDFNAFDAATGLQLWSQRFGAGESSPVVANGVVYVADGSGISATNAATGQSLWSGSTGGIVYSSPAVANGVLYLGSDDDNLYAFGLPPHSTSARAVLPPSRPNPAALKPDPKLH